jgi:hypothetical protein
MKMPEGLIKLAESRGSTVEALHLMKEMAEALEGFVTSQAYNRLAGDSDSILEQCEHALEKFKEWK